MQLTYEWRIQLEASVFWNWTPMWSLVSYLKRLVENQSQSRISPEIRLNNVLDTKLDEVQLMKATAQFRDIKIQPKTIDLSTRLCGINPTNSVVIAQSLVFRSIVLVWILIYRNWSMHLLSSNYITLFTYCTFVSLALDHLIFHGRCRLFWKQYISGSISCTKHNHCQKEIYVRSVSLKKSLLHGEKKISCIHESQEKNSLVYVRV